MADTLQHIGIETLEEIIPYTKKVTVKQSYIDDELWSKIENTVVALYFLRIPWGLEITRLLAMTKTLS